MYKDQRLIKLYAEDGSQVYTQCFAVVGSVSADELVRADQLGAKARYKLTINSAEYDLQQYIELDGAMYAVYRTYDAGNCRTELYIEDKLGVG